MELLLVYWMTAVNRRMDMRGVHECIASLTIVDVNTLRAVASASQNYATSAMKRIFCLMEQSSLNTKYAV